MPSNRFRLWLDLETSGLDAAKDTVLEAGWLVTDSSLEQLTPMRSRLCHLVAAPRSSSLVNTITIKTPITVPSLTSKTGWLRDGEAYTPIEGVDVLHRRSGLYTDWLTAPRQAILTTVAELDRLIIDDLLLAGWDGSPEAIVLAGSGVSHFDQRWLQMMGSKLLAYTDPILYYASADVSTGLRVFNIEVPKSTEQLQTMITVTSSEQASPDCVVTTEREGGARINYRTSVSTLNLHRAGDDVISSLLIARCVQTLLSPFSLALDALTADLASLRTPVAPSGKLTDRILDVIKFDQTVSVNDVWVALRSEAPTKRGSVASAMSRMTRTGVLLSSARDEYRRPNPKGSRK